MSTEWKVGDVAVVAQGTNALFGGPPYDGNLAVLKEGPLITASARAWTIVCAATGAEEMLYETELERP